MWESGGVIASVVYQYTLFKTKVLLISFKDKKGKRLYEQDDTYTTAWKNTVKLLKGELSDSYL